MRAPRLLVMAFAVLLLATGPAATQDDSPGFLGRQIENALSAPGREVSVRGFEGALSGRATLAEMTFADADGVWLTLRDAVLDWNRAALLRGRLSVQELSAAEIVVARAPLPAPPAPGLPEPPPAAARGFALPDLPVAVTLGALEVDSLRLGEPILGEAAEFRLTGALALADGEGSVDLSLARLDGPEDRIALEAGFDNDSRVLALDLTVREGAGGLASSLLGIPGAPSLALDIDGTGPLDDYTARIDLSTEGEQRVAGTVTLRGIGEAGAEGLRFAADIGGDVTPVIAPDLRDFFGPDILLVVEGERGSDGALRLEQVALDARSLTLSGAAAIGGDGVPERFEIAGRLADPGGGPVRLPAGAEVLIEGATLDAAFDAAVSEDWTLALEARGVAAPDAAIDRLSLTGGGTITRDGDDLAATAALDYTASGLTLSDPALTQALGAQVGGRLQLGWTTDAPLRIETLTLGGPDYGLRADGTVAVGAGQVEIDGTATVAAQDLARFSGLAGRDLTGAADITVAGRATPIAGTFDATLDLSGTGLSVGDATADPFLDGPVTLSAAARRDETGTFLDRLTLESPALGAEGSARLVPGESALDLTARLADIGLLRPDLDGALALTATATETRPDLWSVDLHIDGPHDSTATLRGAAGITPETAPQTDIALSAALPDIAPLLPGQSGALSVEGRAQGTDDRLWDVDLDVAGPYDLTAAVTGAVGLGTELMRSDVALDIRLPDIAPLVPDVSGAVSVAGRAAGNPEGSWDVDLDLAGPHDLTAAVEGAVGLADALSQTDVALDIRLPDIAPFVPQYSGPVTVSGTAQGAGAGSLRVGLDIGAPYGATATLDGTLLGGAGDVRLTAQVPDVSAFAPGLPGAITLSGTARERADALWDVALDAGLPYGATATVQGAAGAQDSDLTFAARLPDLAALSPQLSGAVSATGSARQTPERRWQIATDIAGPERARATARATLGPGRDGTGLTEATARIDVPRVSAFAPGIEGALTADLAAAQTEAGAWALDLDAAGPFGATLSAEGAIGGGATDATARLAVPNVAPIVPALVGPLTIDATARQQAGRPVDIAIDAALPLSGTAQVTGQIAPGQSALRLTAALPSIAQLAPGIPGGVQVEGTAREGAQGWQVDLTGTGPATASTRISGSLAPDFATADLDIAGSAPLGLANGILAPNRVDGTLSFDLALDGPLAPEALTGTVSTSGTRFEIAALNQALEAIDLSVALSGQQAVIDASARSSAGGSLSVSGPVSLAPPLSSDVTVTLDDLVLSDPRLFTTTLGGQVTIAGPLAGGATIGGRIDVGRTELRIPSGGGGFGNVIPPIDHVGEGAAVRLTRERAGLVDDGRDAEGRGGTRGFGLDLTISAPSQIFLRGRGLDLELGGAFRIGGTTAAPAPVGGIEVIRGRLDLLGKRLELERDGRVTLGGDLRPFLDLTATSTSGDLTVLIGIDGPINNPEFSFSSSPPLPEDEILAQFFFGKGLANLSAFEAAQLAASIAQLTGRGGDGLLGGLREGLGVDDLNVVTDDEGNAGLQVGQYLTDNVYTDVTTSTGGNTEVNINIDLTDNVTVRGSADNDGDSALGIFFQRDY